MGTYNTKFPFSSVFVVKTLPLSSIAIIGNHPFFFVISKLLSVATYDKDPFIEAVLFKPIAILVSAFIVAFTALA